MTIVGKIAYNTVFSTGARIFGIALSLISLGFITRYLGKEGFGAYSLIFAFLFLVDNLADFGLYTLMTREISRPDADEKRIVSNIFTLRIAILILFLGVACILIWFFPYPPQVKIGILIAALATFFLSLGQVLMGVFQKYLRIDKASVADILGRTIQLILVILFIKLNFGLYGIIFALIAGALTNFLLLIIFAQQHVRFSLAINWQYWKQTIKTAFPIAVSIVLTLIYFKIDSIFLSLPIINSHSLSPISDVGIYNIAYKILEGLIFFPAMLVGLIMPLLSNTAFSDLEKFKKIFQKTFDVLMILITPLIIGLLFLAKPIVVLIGGREFVASAPALQILSFAIGIIFLGNLFGSSIIALNKQKIGAWIYFGGMIFNIVANLIFIPKYRYLGAAATTVATELLVTTLMLILIYKTIDYLPRFYAWKSILAGIIMIVFLLVCKNWNFFALITSSTIIYFAILYLIKGITKNEIMLLIKKEI
jgi:O-antigen/teichoic acid export membrane protein